MNKKETWDNLVDLYVVKGEMPKEPFNLAQEDLSEADFHKANLRGANLSGSDLRRANFREANLSVADLSGAMLMLTCIINSYMICFWVGGQNYAQRISHSTVFREGSSAD